MVASVKVKFIQLMKTNESNL